MFPIVVGVGPHYSSSRPFPHIISREQIDDNADGGEVRQQQVIMTMGTNDDETMNATIFIGYHFLPIDRSRGDVVFEDNRSGSDHDDERMALLHGEAAAQMKKISATNNETRLQYSRSSPIDQPQFNVVAELRVQITPITSPFTSSLDSMSNRETKSRVPLGMMRKQSWQDIQNLSSYTPNPSIEFSSNEKHLACLIPFPRGYELLPSPESHSKYPPMSTVVIFRIQAKILTPQQQQRKHNLPKLPNYVLENIIDEDRERGELDTAAIKSAHDLEISESVQHKTSASTVPMASSRGISTSHVAHDPKIVRALIPQNEQHIDKSGSVNNDVSNRLFRRSRSSENGHTGPLHCATCMCNVPSDHHRGESSSAGSFLLVGTTDGKLLKVDFSMARVLSVKLNTVSGDVNKNQDNGESVLSTEPNGLNGERNGLAPQIDQHLKFGFHPIVHLSQCTPTHWKPLDIYGEEQGSISKGRVAAVFRDGSVKIYTTSFALPEKNRINVVESYQNPPSLHGSRSNGTNHIGLDIQFNLIASFLPPLACLDASLSHLRYIRAKWIKPCLLSLLTRSPLLDDDHDMIGWSDNIMMSASKTEMVVAQVWSVAEVTHLDRESQHESQWEIPSDIDAVIALISELKLPRGDGLNEFIHDTYSLSKYTSNPDSGSIILKGRPSFSECTRGMSVLYHRFIDFVAIVSQEVTCTSDSNGVSILCIRPICFIWDWKRNVPGLMLACSDSHVFYVQQDNSDICSVPSIYSWFQLGNDDKYGPCAVHVYEQTLRKDMRRACKSIFCLSTLSPPHVRDPEGSLSVHEPSASLLHRDSITYPRICRQTNSMDVSIEWAESRVPPTYVASNGPCQIAAVGKDFGRSIAVASSRGLCVLDQSRGQQLEPGRFGSTNQSPRWKLFSNINDEHSFRVLSMTWWETANQDFLLAVVKYKFNDALWLACWSSRTGFGFGKSQLLEGPTNRDMKGNDEAYKYGVELPPGFRVHSMSLIKDPADKFASIGSETPNRALLLLAYISHNELASSRIKYALYQLQVILPSEKQERVLTRIVAHGQIPMELGSLNASYAEVVTGIFLAGGSFLFNLDMDNDDLDSRNYIAMIGILTVYHGLLAVCIRQEGATSYRPSILTRAQGGRHRLLVAHWMAGSISSSYGSRISWNIAQNDGEVFYWSVPCRNASSVFQPNGNREPSLEILLGIEQHPLFGDFCHLGLSSLWMNGATTSERELALGPFIPQSFGSTLYAGQRSRKNIVPSKSGATTSFHVSNCIIAPPQFTPVLFVSFLVMSLALCDSDSGWQLIDHPDQGAPERRVAESDRPLARDTVHSILRQVRGLGSSASALRVIALKVIDILDDSKVKSTRARGREIPDGTVSDRFPEMRKWKVGKLILKEIVSAASMIYDELGFATFFLSIGRQLEPHQFNFIFPLPKGSRATNAEDLFILSCEQGSLFTALSALPLFSCHKGSQRSVTKLVYHCLIKIDESFRSCFSSSSITSFEDERFLHQLFWFGVKLEDAIEFGNLHVEEVDGLDCDAQLGENESILDSSQSSIVSSSTESNISDDSDEFGSVDSDLAGYTSDACSSDESTEGSSPSFCQSPRQKSSSGFFQRVTKRVLAASGSSINNHLQEEDAIHEAASSFILTGLGGTSVSSRDKDSPKYNSKPFHSVAAAVCLFIDYEILSGGRDDGHDMLSYGWKAVSLVACLLQGERETSAVTTAGAANAKAIIRMITMKDFVAAYCPHVNLHANDDECCTFVVSLLERITWRCRQQLHSQALDSVLNLVLLLLLRNDTCLDVNLCRPTLVVVGIVAGHLSGRIGDLLDIAETSTINSIYSLYTTRLNS